MKLSDVQREAVRRLRAVTGCGLIEAREALEATAWDVEAAAVWVRNKGNCRCA